MPAGDTTFLVLEAIAYLLAEIDIVHASIPARSVYTSGVVRRPSVDFTDIVACLMQLASIVLIAIIRPLCILLKNSVTSLLKYRLPIVPDPEQLEEDRALAELALSRC